MLLPLPSPLYRRITARLLETVLEETQCDSAQLIVDLEEKLERRLAELKIAEATIADLKRQSGNTVPGSL